LFEGLGAYTPLLATPLYKMAFDAHYKIVVGYLGFLLHLVTYLMTLASKITSHDIENALIEPIPCI